MSRHILVASRDKSLGELAKAAVQTLEYDVVVASDLSLALYLANKNMPDLVVTDEELIGGTGFDLLSELGNDEELNVIPIIFISKESTNSTVFEHATKLGAKKVIPKPTTIDAFFLELMPHLKFEAKSTNQRPEYSPE
ncbi:MAG: response regulator [Leptolyngbya sp.]|nr:response regulator [Candidatus Melainabacteria bacterium]